MSQCCIANISDPNANTANFDTSNITAVKDGKQLVSAVSNFYASAAGGIIRPNAQPIFKSYQQMMSWKQAQNRR
jgi:hypothetical protein